MRKKLFKISGFIAFIIVIISGIYFLSSYAVNTKVSKTSAIQSQTNANTGSAGTLASGEKDPDKYSYHTRTGQFEAIYGTSDYSDPKYGDYQIYCIQPGAVLKFKYDISYAEAMALRGKSYTSDCIKSGHGSTPHDGDTTPPVYTEIGTYPLPVAAAYIVSETPIGQWSRDKQKAIWNLRNSGLDGGLVIGDGISKEPGKHGDPSTSIYDQEAIDYANYDKTVRNTGLNPTDKTNLNGVYTKISQTKKEYTVGPFNITYTNGIYGNLAFAGISDMTVIGYNGKKEVVKSDIKVKKIILKDTATGIYGSGVTPEFFTPSSDLKVDETKQVYPVSGQDFQIVFDDPNAGLSEDSDNRVTYISIKVKFKYMLANGQYTKLKGTKYTVGYSHDESYNPHRHHSGCHKKKSGRTCHHYVDCNGCKTTCYLDEADQQTIAAMDAIRSIYEQEVNIGISGDRNTPPIILLNTSMDLGGHVWEDGVATKESKADGVSNTDGGKVDKALKNVKVTLYTSNGKVAKLLSNPNEEGITEEQVMHRVNPTYTDAEGNYLFEGLDPMKKYYVRFEYNGQIYLPTEYLNTEGKQYSTVSEMVNAKLYNTDKWKVTSKGTETVQDRNNYDKKFEEIGSYPENYISSNSLGKTGNKNAAFTQKDLMGYTLDREGKYKQTATQLIDGYLYDENGLETTEYKEGVISQKVRQYIKENKKFPDDNAMKGIYNSIAGNTLETWRKLQFVEDCKISSYTQGQGKNKDLYPVYDVFRINHADNWEKYKTAKEAQNGKYDMKVEVLDGVTYNPIYPGQFFVNQGLWRRQEFDAAMRKDVYRSVMKINNKTVMYKYDKRSNDDKYWDINVRMSDYDSYYNSGYNREVYRTDYEYSSKALNHPGADLEIYVTYKLTIRNQSQSIMNQIKEVVDYYDKDYTYRDDLSWVTYVGDGKTNSITDKEYFNAMVKEKISEIKNARATKSSTTSKYGASTHSDITKAYNAVYVRGLENKKLATGESAYIYLTFQVKKDSNGRVILDSESSPKMNYAEINGYTTYYRDGTTLSNNVTKNSNDIAGLLDRDSNPGNLVQSDINDKDRGEKNFEDDTDRAKAIRVIIDESAVRKANGTVWEDERTVKSGDSIIGDGIRGDKEEGVNGVTVQLVEKTVDGKEYIWQETKTDASGKYEFARYIPGDYVVRFYYGNNADNTKVKGNKDYTAGGLNSISYNGQDFKSTTYQKDIKQTGYTDESKRYTGYTNTSTQNETGTYGYDIYAADSNKNNVSDAKDLWTTSNIPSITYRPNTTISEKKTIHGRQVVNDYSNSNVTDHKAEVLASPYETPSYNDTKYTKAEMDALVNELINNTYMTAETGVIAVEFEYDRQQTDGLKETENNSSNSSKDYVSESNRHNGNYVLANIDLGLVERPKAQLELDKQISNIKVTLANGSVLFDVNKAGDNVIWKTHEAYKLNEKATKSGFGYKELKDTKKYDDYYGKAGHRYSYRTEVNNIVKKSDKGLVQLTMDEELMHGATIEIKYKVTVTNVGETDYEGQKYYYLGDKQGAKIVTTVANQVVDYVANNLQFNASNAENNKWTVINNASLITSQGADNNDNLVNRRLINNVKQYNTTVQTDGLNKSLKPGESTDKTIVLSQLISTENSSDDLTYSNMAEIVKTSNTVGRRMAFSVVGNQDPTASNASEVDSSVAEKVVILPPFGNTHIYYILGAVIAVILIAGITFIIVKVNKKRE